MDISEQLEEIQENIKSITTKLEDIKKQLNNGPAEAADSVHDEAAEAAAEAAAENAAARKDTETGAAQEDAEADRARAARVETPERAAQRAKLTAMVAARTAARTASTVKLPDDTMLSLGLEKRTYGEIKKMLNIPRLKILRNNNNTKDKALLEQNGISSNYKDKIKGNLENAKTPVEAQAIINSYNLTLDNGMIAGTRKRKVNKSRSKFRNKSRNKSNRK